LERLNNKIALVTGASSGIGLACAQALVREGCRVIITGRRADRLEKVAQTVNKLDFNLSLQTAIPETFIL